MGANVHSRRVDLGISARELAERLTRIGRRFTLSGVQKVERAERRVDVDDLLALADALETSPTALLGLDGAPRRTPLGELLEVGRRHPDLRRALNRAVAAGAVSADALLDYADASIRLLPAAQKYADQYAEFCSKLDAARTVADAVAVVESAAETEGWEPTELSDFSSALRADPEALFPGRSGFGREVADELEHRGR